MPIDISAYMDAATWQGLTTSSAGSVLSTSSASASASIDSLVATSSGLSSVSSNGIDLVALSAQALVDDASDVTGLGEGVDLESLVGDLSPMALSGLLDSTNDSALLSAYFGSTSTDALLNSVVSSSSSS